MFNVLQTSDEALIASVATIIQHAAAMARGFPIPEVCMAKKAAASLDHSTDLYLGDLALSGRSEETRRKYRWLLEQFCQMFEHLTPAEINEEHCRRFLNQWANSSPSTLALHVTILRCFFRFLIRQKIIVGASPMENIERPRRHHPEDLDVVSVSAREVRLMFDSIETWQELICLGVFCYAGVRRDAAATARRRDVDFDAGMIKFREKGGKVIVKPIADELGTILRAADQADVWESPNAWLIPELREHPWPQSVTREPVEPDRLRHRQTDREPLPRRFPLPRSAGGVRCPVRRSQPGPHDRAERAARPRPDRNDDGLPQAQGQAAGDGNRPQSLLERHLRVP